jgi:small subunit ribosomal protein S8
MMTDPIADMLARIRNAIMARNEFTEIPLSKLKLRIAEILKAEGYIADFSVKDEHPASFTVYLKYDRQHRSAIVGMRRKSSPGRRIYARHGAIPEVLGGMGIAIVSTSRGVLTSADAGKQRLGGEVLCEVW